MGSAPGEFRTPHALAFDSRGRLFVADRGNHRLQIFDQDGKLLETFVQFGRVSGLFIDKDDTLYAIDSESSATRHPGWKTGIRIGTAKEDKVTAFIPPETGEPHGAREKVSPWIPTATSTGRKGRSPARPPRAD
jgi:sugar lactone lactonase YvrE